jgi:two-component system, sensor histidine kinase
MPKRVLLVIPDEDAAVIYETYLSTVAHFLVQRVSTSLQGFEQSSRSAPDLIVTDYPMKVDRGRSLIRALREAGFELPIIAVSVQCEPHMIATAYEDGVTLFLPVPILPATLGDAVRRLVEPQAANQV